MTHGGNGRCENERCSDSSGNPDAEHEMTILRTESNPNHHCHEEDRSEYETMPTDVNDGDISENTVLQPSSQPTQMSLVIFKIRLFQLSTQICRHISGPQRLDTASLYRFDTAIAGEQEQWTSMFLVDGAPSLLDITGYASWCVLQTYAHQLYLLLHRPFCNYHSDRAHFIQSSRDRCVESSLALLDLHRQFCELPRLRNYQWLVYGLTSFNALHGAVALASCLLDRPNDLDSAAYCTAFDDTIRRMESLQERSPVCVKALPILRHIQTQLFPDHTHQPGREDGFDSTFESWIDAVQWFNPESINWDLWNHELGTDAG
ncbi:hypothetical protein RU639_003867 [Aspergillus parasiticus]